MGELSFLLRRYLLPREGNLLSFALWISVAGVALGVVQLMVVLAVMSGFVEVFQNNYTRISSELVVVPRQRAAHEENFAAKLRAIPGIAAVTPAGLGQGMVLKNGVGGVILEGIDLQTSGKVTPWEDIWVEKPREDLQAKNSYWIWLGKQLADKLKVKSGDSVDVLVADGQARRIIPFVVTAIVKFGIYDHDLRYARIDIQVLNEIFRRHHLDPIYKCRLEPGANLDDVARRTRAELGKIATVKLWSDINQNVFLAVKHQKSLLFLILQIVVALAAMNVVNLLMMSSHQRRRDIAILRAMGMRYSRVLAFFVFQGAAVGFVGVILGVGLGYLACLGVEYFQPSILSEAVYNVTRLPVRVRFGDVSLIAVAGLLLCILFSLLPAIGAARVRPVNALRYE